MTWTLAEAADWLDPPIGEAQLRQIVTALRIAPVKAEARPRDQAGRPPKRYGMVEIMALHSALAPWLTRNLSDP